ncbi:partitioning defective 6 B likeeta [Crotalus adamanteus]|uniref:Partitioning defective 6 B likeeta n=1 Tax=Crotalus adamanteus TaxID=8729 RepID=A0AAW1BRM7_CROAD
MRPPLIHLWNPGQQKQARRRVRARRCGGAVPPGACVPYSPSHPIPIPLPGGAGASARQPGRQTHARTNWKAAEQRPAAALPFRLADPTFEFPRGMNRVQRGGGSSGSGGSHGLGTMEVKSKFGAEFRRFSLEKSKPGKFEEFYGLLQHVHKIPNVEVLVGYTDIHGDLLPINNDDNYHKAVSTANPLLRIFIQRKEDADYSAFGTDTMTRKKNVLSNVLRPDNHRKKPHIVISLPQDFRPVSSIIDVDILPETHRRGEPRLCPRKARRLEEPLQSRPPPLQSCASKSGRGARRLPAVPRLRS